MIDYYYSVDLQEKRIYFLFEEIKGFTLKSLIEENFKLSENILLKILS